MGFSLSAGSKAVSWMTVAGVLVVGLVDWVQGAAPEGTIDVGDEWGLALFALSAIGVAFGAQLIAERAGDEPAMGPWVVVVALASAASLLADPTYAVLLFAVPLIHIARRWPDPLRRLAVLVLFGLTIVLVSLENQSWGGNNLESAMIAFIALLVTTILGHTLGHLDALRARESEDARRNEREQLAAELHDSVGHSLLASSIQLQNARALWGSDSTAARRSVELASRAVDDALVDTRVAVDTVRSRSAPFSLTAALPDLIKGVASPSLDVELILDGPVESVEQLAQITLYRVAQEALTNVVRHASASQAIVTHAANPADVVLTISDDGRGFDVDADALHLGLRGLEERVQRIGGTLAVSSRPDGGTQVTARVERR